MWHVRLAQHLASSLYLGPSSRRCVAGQPKSFQFISMLFWVCPFSSSFLWSNSVLFSLVIIHLEDMSETFLSSPFQVPQVRYTELVRDNRRNQFVLCEWAWYLRICPPERALLAFTLHAAMTVPQDRSWSLLYTTYHQYTHEFVDTTYTSKSYHYYNYYANIITCCCLVEFGIGYCLR